MSKRVLTGIAVVAIIAVAAVFYVSWGSGPHSQALADPSCCRADPAAQHMRVTLDPSIFKGKVREAYMAAQRHPGVLAQLHCYCGCEQAEGHHDLLDCYRDRHAQTCEICIGEALMAARMTDQGMPVEQIRDAIRARYAHGS